MFFVNLSNIVEKTRENFCNPVSSKYLFADEIVLDGERIRINQVNNFQYSDQDAINICFATHRDPYGYVDGKGKWYVL